MEQQALELITDRLNAVLSGQGFALTQQGKADSARPALFFGERAAYAVVYDKKAKRFELRQTALDDDKQPGEWSSVSAWLFDPATDTLKDAESIANDFCQSVEVVVEKRAVAAKKAKKEKTDEKYVDPAFLMKRFVPVFPELNYAIQAHRTQYGAIIPHALCRKFLVPMVQELLADPAETKRQERLMDILNRNYANGDLDTKSLITLGILNSVTDPAQVTRAEALASDELRGAWLRARKYKGKKVKPEKVKKRTQLSAETSSGSLR